MISAQNLYDIAKSRYNEARILNSNGKPDGAIYLCGYALELILKRGIVIKLDWDGYPDSNAEFDGFKSFRIHKLDILLHLSGLKKKIQADAVMFARWQIAGAWDSEVRYKKVGTLTKAEAEDIINATRDVINFILTTK